MFIANRPGNRPSAEGAEHYFDKAIRLCQRAGFDDILLRGDTAFALTRHFDRWTAQGARFVFGYTAHENVVEKALDIAPEEYQQLVRMADEAFARRNRAKPSRVKREIIEERG